MASDTQRIITLEDQVRRLLATVSAFQGQPSNATLSIPHNDSWIFEDNVDATHAANLRYIIAKNVTRVVSARLSIFVAPYRTYNNFSATVTNLETTDHFHAGAAHNHALLPQNIAGAGTMAWNNSSPGILAVTNLAPNADTTSIQSTTPGNGGGRTSAHQHTISVTSTLGVTEGATATGVTVAFDGVDATAALGGPFNADVIELDVRRFLGTTQNVKHTIAMKPSGLGRIEAHLRLGVYVSAGQTL